MLTVIIGNVCSICAILIDAFSGTRKSNREVLLVQCISQFFYFTSSVVLKGYSAAAQNVVSLFRNFFAAKEKTTKALEVVLVILPVVLGVIFNNRGLMGLVPVVANLEYSIAMFAFKGDVKKLKYALIINCIMFSIFNFAILNVAGGIACLVTAVTTAISIFTTKKNNKE